MTAVTLLENAQFQNANLKEGMVIFMFTQESQIFKTMPFKPIKGRWYDYTRENALAGGPFWRPANQQWVSTITTHTPYREHLKILGGIVDVDPYISTTDLNGPQDEKRRQTKGKIQALMNEFDRCIIEGSELESTDEIIGWRSRCNTAGQLQLAGAGGATLTLRMIHNLIDSVKGENSKKQLYMNPTLRIKMWDLIDAAGSGGSRYRIETEEGSFGTMIERYGGVRVNVMRTEGDNTTMLGFDEDPGDGTSDTASIYCVYYDEDDGVVGLYNHGPDGQMIMVEETQRVNGQPLDRLLFEGYYGQAVHQPRALGRLYGINNA